MEIRREKAGAGAGQGGSADDFRIRQLRARDMLRGDIEGEELERHVEERVLTTTLDRAVSWRERKSSMPPAPSWCRITSIRALLSARRTRTRSPAGR